MVTVYLICLFVGLVFVLVSAILGGVFHAADVSGHGPEVAVGDHDISIGSGHDIGGGHGGGPDGQFDTDVGGSGPGVAVLDSAAHLSPWSPFIISTIVACFGGGGLIALEVFGPDKYYVHVPIAAVFGIGLGLGTFYIVNRIFKATAASSHFSDEELVGVNAEVIVTIPEKGTGEISFIAAGSNMSYPARAEGGKEIPAHSKVQICRVSEGTAYVKESAGAKFERLLGRRK
jgi:membrane protein implicated in regulation of membrane protease activity